MLGQLKRQGTGKLGSSGRKQSTFSASDRKGSTFGLSMGTLGMGRKGSLAPGGRKGSTVGLPLLP